MALPISLPTKNLTFGQAVVMESGTVLPMRVTVKASRSLLHRPTGQPLISFSTVFNSTTGGSGQLTLPVCDSGDMGTGNGTTIVLGAGQVTHTYTAMIEYLHPTTNTIIQSATRTIGPFIVRQSDPDVVDIDDLLVSSTDPVLGIAVHIPDSWSASVAAAEAASEEASTAAAAVLDSVAAFDDRVENVEGELTGRLSGVSLSAAYASLPGANIPRTLARLRTDQPLAVSIIGDSKHDPGTVGNASGTAMENALDALTWSASTITVTNVAESGHTMARQFIQGNVTTAVNAAPDLLVFEIGTNDTNSDDNGVYAAGYPLAASLAAVERACAYARDSNEACEFLFILTTPYTPASSANAKIVTYNDALRALAATWGAEVVDGYQTFLDYDDDWTPLLLDSTHRNGAGNDVLEAAILDHFPAAGKTVPATLAPRPVKGRFDISRMDKAKGALGYLTFAAPVVAVDGSYVLTGTGWSTSGSFDVTSTVGDAFTLTGTKARELLVNPSLEAVYMPVVDFYLDDLLVSADVNLNAQSNKNTVNYWLAPFTDLDGGTHTMKMVLKSGTLRISSAVVVVGGTPTFTPETRFLQLGTSAVSTALPTDGTYVAAVLDTVVSKPSGWGTYDLVVRAVISNRVNGATTTYRQIHTRLRLGSVASQAFLNDFDPVAVSETRTRQIPATQSATALTGNTQVRLDARVLSTDKTGCFLTGHVIDALLIRTG